MPFVKEQRFMSFVTESDTHADKINLAIETLSNDVSKLRAEIKILQSQIADAKTTSPAPKAKASPSSSKVLKK
tara:strand:- start:255 stop:473 length:219 start_codon:yes stop_codon:yes gene_type:complete